MQDECSSEMESLEETLLQEEEDRMTWTCCEDSSSRNRVLQHRQALAFLAKSHGVRLVSSTVYGRSVASGTLAAAAACTATRLAAEEEEGKSQSLHCQAATKNRVTQVMKTHCRMAKSISRIPSCGGLSPAPGPLPACRRPPHPHQTHHRPRCRRRRWTARAVQDEEAQAAQQEVQKQMASRITTTADARRDPVASGYDSFGNANANVSVNANVKVRMPATTTTSTAVATTLIIATTRQAVVVAASAGVYPS